MIGTNRRIKKRVDLPKWKEKEDRINTKNGITTSICKRM